MNDVDLNKDNFKWKKLEPAINSEANPRYDLEFDHIVLSDNFEIKVFGYIRRNCNGGNIVGVSTYIKSDIFKEKRLEEEKLVDDLERKDLEKVGNELLKKQILFWRNNLQNLFDNVDLEKLQF